jgi:hypothetical protein
MNENNVSPLKYSSQRYFPNGAKAPNPNAFSLQFASNFPDFLRDSPAESRCNNRQLCRKRMNENNASPLKYSSQRYFPNGAKAPNPPNAFSVHSFLQQERENHDSLPCIRGDSVARVVCCVDCRWGSTEVAVRGNATRQCKQSWVEHTCNFDHK